MLTLYDSYNSFILSIKWLWYSHVTLTKHILLFHQLTYILIPQPVMCVDRHVFSIYQSPTIYSTKLCLNSTLFWSGVSSAWWPLPSTTWDSLTFGWLTSSTASLWCWSTYSTSCASMPPRYSGPDQMVCMQIICWYWFEWLRPSGPDHVLHIYYNK